MSRDFGFRVVASDSETHARTGVLRTAHGEVSTPLFLPVGTSAAVKMLSPQELSNCRVRMVLGNTYHLLHQPGVETIAAAGGLARFMAWDGPTLTDSGGFQVYSLAATRNITESGVSFRSVYDGREIVLTPESVLELQVQIGADVIYALDECVPYPATHQEVERGLNLTLKWERRFLDAWRAMTESGRTAQIPFLVVQGGLFDDLRIAAVHGVTDLEPSGFGIGGVSVGEPREEMLRVAALCCELLPPDKPRHLMGVGTPADLLDAIATGVDMFDCVLPTRNGRNGQAFTSEGAVNLRNAKNKMDFATVDSKCDCYCCSSFTRAYLHHLINTGELLGMRLLSLHNLVYYQRLMSEARAAIQNGSFPSWKRGIEAGWMG